MELKALILQLDQFGLDGIKCVVICIDDDEEIQATTNVTDYRELDELITKGYNLIVE